MNFQYKRLSLALSLALALASVGLSGCGGGGGGTTAAPVVADTTPLIEGTAAIGAALTNATVSITDRTGSSVCSNDPITTNATGAYSCRVKPSAVAPFAIVVTDPDGLVNPMISVLATRPAEGASSTANVTPLTTAIAAQLDVNKDAFALVRDPSSLATVDVARLNAVKANVVRQLASILADAGIDAANFDPITTAFTGGNHTGVDRMLDQVRVTFNNGLPELSNALNPNAAAVPMADSSTTTPPVVTTSAITTAFSPSELDFAKTKFEACFALPVATRATLDTANRLITDVHSACAGITVDEANVVGVEFLQNGYTSSAYFYDLMSDSAMEGARFNLPEIIRYTTRTDGKDEAVLNIKFRDKNGIIGSRILTAKKLPNTATNTRNTNWWLYGNQRAVDAVIRASARKREQTILDTTNLGNAAASRYETGLEIFIRRPNFASANNPNGGMQYVRVTGPGLPVNGLVLADVASTLPQHWMGILNTTGNVPTGSQQLAGTHGGSTANIFTIQRTHGITGTSAFTVRPNPFVGNATPSFVTFAHPSMYNQVANANWSFDLSQVPAWSRYSLEAFDGTSSTPTRSWTSPILTPVMPAAFAATQQWHSFGTSSRDFVTVGAATTSSVDISWSINTLAERVASVNAYSQTYASNTTGAAITARVNSASINAAKGVSSVTATAVNSGDGSQYLSIGANSTNARTLQLRFGMLDGSYKDQNIHFN